VDYQWEFTDSGTLNAPGGAILSSETETINNTFITYDLSSASRINKVYWESGGDQPTLRYLHLGVATDAELPLEVVAYQLEDELNGYGATGGRIIRFTATSGTTYSVTIPQYSNIQWSTSITELGGEPGISWLIQEGVWGDNGAPTADTIIDITSLSYSSLDTYYRNFAIEIPSPDSEDEYRWEFSNSGTLIVPGTITKETRLTLNSSGPESGYTAAVLADGNLGKVLLRTDNGTITKTWEFDVSGNLTLPANGTISYSPSNTDNWNEPGVNTVQAALDELAARVTALQNYEIDGGNAYTPPQGETIIDGNGA
jgi:hypothetical protein